MDSTSRPKQAYLSFIATALAFFVVPGIVGAALSGGYSDCVHAGAAASDGVGIGHAGWPALPLYAVLSAHCGFYVLAFYQGLLQHRYVDLRS